VAAVLLVVLTGLLGLGAGAVLTRLAGGFPWAERRFGPPAVPTPVGELVTGLLCAYVALCLGPAWDLPAFLVLVGAGVLLALVDLRHRLLPNRVLLWSGAAAAVLLTLAAAVEGEWSRLGRAALGAVVLFAVFLVLALLSPGQLAMGDVKLAALLGGYLGWLGWDAVLLGGAAGFVLQALLALGMLAARRVGLRGELPFGPAMIAGALVAVGWISLAG
jgi:leader peptidase (prepilin peptidase)/N-methyltransferase